MEFSSLCGRVLLCTACCLAAFGASGDFGNASQAAMKLNLDRMDRSWKRYRNPERGYCVSYPSRWSRGGAFEGSGFLVQTGIRRYSKPTGEIDIGPMNLESFEDARLKPTALSAETLDQDLHEHLEGLKKFERAERLEILDQHSLNLQGNHGLYVKNRYYDPLERAHWVEEVVFLNHKGEVYRLEMQCPPDQIQRFEPVFSYLVNTLEFDCKQ